MPVELAHDELSPDQSLHLLKLVDVLAGIGSQWWNFPCQAEIAQATMYSGALLAYLRSGSRSQLWRLLYGLANFDDDRLTSRLIMELTTVLSLQED